MGIKGSTLALREAPRARQQHLSVFCIIAPRKAIFLDGMTQAGINTVISAQETAGSGKKKDRGGGGGGGGDGTIECTMVLLMCAVAQSLDHLCCPAE